jgi:broad specificity phosphatase PhoE
VREAEVEMKIYFAHHGESEANLLHEHSNRGFKHPLTAKGRTQAMALAEALEGIRIERIYSSPLMRAVQKADVFAEMTGIDRLFVETRPENAAALALYEKCGYTVFERTPENVKMEKHRSESA